MADRGYSDTVLTKVYYVDTFLKRLANIDHDSYTLLGFHAYIVLLPDHTSPNDLQDAINDQYLNDSNYRIYDAPVDFYDISHRNEQFLLNLKIRDTSKSFIDSNPSHIILAYETIDNKDPLTVTEHGLEFSNEFEYDTELNKSNIACVIDWISNGTINNLPLIANGETLRILLDLHQYRINTNFVSIHLPKGDGLDHSHGLSSLTKLVVQGSSTESNNKLSFDESTVFITGKSNIQRDTITANRIALSPLVTIKDDDSIYEVPLADYEKAKKDIIQKEVMYEDWNDSIDSHYGES